MKLLTSLILSICFYFSTSQTSLQSDSLYKVLKVKLRTTIREENIHVGPPDKMEVFDKNGRVTNILNYSSAKKLLWCKHSLEYDSLGRLLKKVSNGLNGKAVWQSYVYIQALKQSITLYDYVKKDLIASESTYDSLGNIRVLIKNDYIQGKRTLYIIDSVATRRKLNEFFFDSSMNVYKLCSFDWNDTSKYYCSPQSKTEITFDKDQRKIKEVIVAVDKKTEIFYNHKANGLLLSIKYRGNNIRPAIERFSNEYW